MSTHEYTFDCECGEQVVLDLEIDSYGCSPTLGTWANPWGEPGEGPSFSFPKAVTCEGCGRVFTQEALETAHMDKAAEAIERSLGDRDCD